LSEIKQLGQADHQEVKTYLYQQFWPCIDIIKVFEKTGLRQDFINKDAGVYYGYYYEGNLEGLVVFTNNKKMMVHYRHPSILKKVDVLKAIKKHKPEYATGPVDQLKSIWKMFERTLKRYNYKETYYMLYEDQDLKTITSDLCIRPAILEDAKYHMNFFLNVERQFDRKHMTINQIKDRINDRLGSREYLLIQDGDYLVGQGFVEEKIHAFWQIGGVYTSPKYRGQGLGRLLVSELIQTIQNQGCVPVLAVLKDNLPAYNLYKSMGFVAVMDFGILELEF